MAYGVCGGAGAWRGLDLGHGEKLGGVFTSVDKDVHRLRGRHGFMC